MNPDPESITYLTGGCLWPIVNEIAADCYVLFLLAMGLLALILRWEQQKTKALREALRRECD